MWYDVFRSIVYNMAKRRRRQRKVVTMIGFLFLLLLAGLVCYLVWDSYFKDKNNEGSGNEEPKADQLIEDKTKKEEESKEQPKEEIEDEVEVEDEKEQPSYDGENPNQGGSLTGVVTRAESIGEQLVIRVNIDQYLGEGECRLNLKSGDEVVYSDMANIVGSAATATCEGFDVPVADIGGGSFAIEIVVNSGDKTGVISGEVGV